MKHFLQTLGLTETASWAEIKEAYRDQIRVWHPDRFAGDERLHAKAEEMTKEIHYALRRLKELRSDLEKRGQAFVETEPFLKQYYYKTNGGKGDHGRVTLEDRSRGYLQDSFGKWEAVTGIVRERVTRRATTISERSEKRSRRPTVVLRQRRGSHIPTFLVASGMLVVIASIGAIRIPQLLKHGQETTLLQDGSSRTPEADRKLLQTLLEEPIPNYQKNLDQRTKLDLIEKRRREQRPAVVSAAMDCDVGQVETLLNGPIDIDAQDSSGQTALMWAAKRNCPGAIRALLKRGAKSRTRSSNGFSAHRWAKWYKNDDSIKVLESLGVKE